MRTTKSDIGTVIKVGFYCNIINNNKTRFDTDQLQAFVAFKLAIDEINNRTDILPNAHLAVAIRSGNGAYDAVLAALELGQANFSSAAVAINTGVSDTDVDSELFIGGSAIGIDVAVNGGDNTETVSMNLMLGNQDTVEFHTRATDTQFGFGSNFPFKIQMAPIDSFQGMVWQDIMCTYYGYHKFAIFSTADTNGIQTSIESADGTYCSMTKMIVQSFPFNTVDFSPYIAAVKSTGAQIFFVIAPAPTAGRLLLQAYQQGLLREGTQVIGPATVTSSSLWTSLGSEIDVATIKAMMRGYLGLIYAPSYNLHDTSLGSFGKDFVRKMRAHNESFLCDHNNMVDDSGVPVLTTEAYQLLGSCPRPLNFTSFKTDGTDMYPFAPHAYDAVYALAYAFDGLLGSDAASTVAPSTVSGTMLHNYLMYNVSFEGASGYVKFYSGMPSYLNYAEGDREEGNNFMLYNFQESAFTGDGSELDGFALVGKWSLEDGGFVPCNDANKARIGVGFKGGCVTSIVYNTADGLPALDTPPDIYISLSPGLRGFVAALGALVILGALFTLAVVLVRRTSKLVKASQPEMVFIILVGCILAGLRAIMAALEVTDGSCAASFWLGHVSFCATYFALMFKMWRIHRVVNNKTLKRMKISGQYVAGLTMGALLFVCVYLAVATGVGRPHHILTTVTVANQTTLEYLCAIEKAEFQTALFAMEAAALCYGARLCWATKDVPDAINESKFIASGMVILLLICGLVFPIIFLLNLSPSVQILIASVAFAVATIGIGGIIFVPKLMILVPGNDIEGLGGGIKEKERKKKDTPSAAAAAVRPSLAAATGTSGGKGSGGGRNATDTMLLAPPDLRNKSYGEKVQLCRAQIDQWRFLLAKTEQFSGESGGSSSRSGRSEYSRHEPSMYRSIEPSMADIAVYGTDSVNSNLDLLQYHSTAASHSSGSLFPRVNASSAKIVPVDSNVAFHNSDGGGGTRSPAAWDHDHTGGGGDNNIKNKPLPREMTLIAGFVALNEDSPLSSTGH